MPAALTSPGASVLALEPDQQLVGFMTNVAWGGLLDEVNGLVEKMESLPDGDVKNDLFRLLDGIDTMHREALRRLVRLFKEGVLEKVGFSSTLLFNLEKAGDFPQHFMLTPRCAVWSEAEIDEWLRQRAASNMQPKPGPHRRKASGAA